MPAVPPGLALLLLALRPAGARGAHCRSGGPDAGQNAAVYARTSSPVGRSRGSIQGGHPFELAPAASCHQLQREHPAGCRVKRVLELRGRRRSEIPGRTRAQFRHLFHRSAAIAERPARRGCRPRERHRAELDCAAWLDGREKLPHDRGKRRECRHDDGGRHHLQAAAISLPHHVAACDRRQPRGDGGAFCPKDRRCQLCGARGDEARRRRECAYRRVRGAVRDERPPAAAAEPPLRRRGTGCGPAPGRPLRAVPSTCACARSRYHRPT